MPLKHVDDEGAYAVQKSVPLEKINRQSINEAGNSLGYEPDYLPANNHLCYRVGLAFVLYLGESDSFQDALFYQYHPLDILCTEYPRGLVDSYL